MGKKLHYSLHNESRARLAEAEETPFGSREAVAYFRNEGKM